MMNEILKVLPTWIISGAVILITLVLLERIYISKEAVSVFGQAFGPTGDSGEIPEGAVIAFDRSSGCPDGWSEFSDAAGRTIVGYGKGQYDANNSELTQRKYREDGGTEAEILTADQLAPHGHEILYQGANIVTLDDTPFLNAGTNRYLFKPETYVGGKGNIRSVFTAMPKGTAAVPVNNMPPYLVLYLCRKG